MSLLPGNKNVNIQSVNDNVVINTNLQSVEPGIEIVLGEGTVVDTHNYIWNTNTLAWEKATGGSGAGDVTVTNFPATYASTQSGSWTVTANAGTNLNTSLLAKDSTLTDGTQITKLEGNGNTVHVTVANALKVDGSATTQPISAASLPLPTGAAKDSTLTDGTQISQVEGNGNIAHVTGSNALKVDGSATTQPVSGTVSANQSGAWNINDISGTVSLPTGAATESTLSTRLSDTTFTNRINTQGQKTMSSSTPVVIASDQSTLNVNLLTSASGLALDSTLTDGSQKTQLVNGANVASISGTGALKVDGSSVTQPISASSLPLPTGAAQEHTAANSPSSVRLTDGTSFYKATTPSDTQPISGNVGINAGSNLIGSIKLTDSAGSNQASISASGAVKVDGSASIQPVSGTVSAAQSGTWNINNVSGTVNLPTGAATESTLSTRLADSTFTGRINTFGQKASASSTPVVIASDQSAIPSSQSGTWNINNISGTISLPTGAATESTLSTRLADSTFTGRINTLGQKTAANSTPVVIASDQSSIPAAQSGSWTVTSNQGTANSAANRWPTYLTDGTNNMPTMDAAARSGYMRLTDGTETALITPQGSQIIIPDQATLDAFGRFRTGQPKQLFGVKEDLQSQTLYYNTSTATGGTVTYNSSRSSTTLAVTSSTGSQAIRQSRAYFPYQPGKSSSMLLTGVVGAGSANVVKRLGMFDANNGVFFELSGTTKNVVVRSNVSGSPVDTAIAQANWNLDKMDGTGTSGVNIDYTKTNIFFIDFQWLGVGRVRFGFVVGGLLIYCHEVNNANVNTAVYMRSPNLPVRWEITNNAGGAGGSVEMICSSVLVEGDFDGDTGLPFSCANFGAGKTISTTQLPLIILRPKSGFPRPPILFRSIEVCGSAQDYFWGLYLNPTITGGTAPSYTSVSANSYLEYDVAATGTVSGGTLLMSGVSSSVGRVDTQSLNHYAFNILNSDFAGTTVDTLVLAIQQRTGAGVTYIGSMNWEEYP